MRKSRPTHAPRLARVAAACGLALALAAPALADDPGHVDLPPGPIRDRHELMEGVGRDAKAIGAALKAGKPADAAAPASSIASVMDRFVTLFPEGSQGQGSRALPAVWTDRKKFDALAMQLESDAAAFAEAAKTGGDVKTTSQAMWKTCKACHDDFREPIEGE